MIYIPNFDKQNLGTANHNFIKISFCGNGYDTDGIELWVPVYFKDQCSSLTEFEIHKSCKSTM